MGVVTMTLEQAVNWGRTNAMWPMLFGLACGAIEMISTVAGTELLVKGMSMPVKDPVCGMEIEPNAAFATRQSKGQTFYFCSENRLKQFDAAPGKYRPAVPSATTGIAENETGPLKLELPVHGLNRSGGPALLKALETLPGVNRVHVNVRTGRATIEYDPARAKSTDFVDAIRTAGFNTDGQSLRLKVSG